MQPDAAAERPLRSAAQLRRTVNEFIDLLEELEDAHNTIDEMTVKKCNGTWAKVVLAIVTETYAAARATKLLVRDGLMSDALAASRRALEHAVTAAWLASDRRSVEKFVMRKGRYSSAQLARAMWESGVLQDPQILQEAEAEAPSRREVEAVLQNFEQLCRTFHPRLYLVYRLASRAVHPSLGPLGRVFGDQDDEDEQLAYAAQALLAMHLATASTVWAGRALDRFHVGQPFKRQLKQAARKLYISPVLYPGMPEDTSLWPA